MSRTVHLPRSALLAVLAVATAALPATAAPTTAAPDSTPSPAVASTAVATGGPEEAESMSPNDSPTATADVPTATAESRAATVNSPAATAQPGAAVNSRAPTAQSGAATADSRAPTAQSGAATADSPAATARSFYAVLLEAMKRGPQLGFDGRRKLLDPEIRRDFDLPLMTRIIVGPPWREIPPARQAELVEAFSAFSVANYANEFTGFSGERFIVDPTATPRPNGDAIVHTRLVPADGKPIEFDYLMRRDQGRWRVLDVYLTGAISQLAARRSEFTTVLREGGAAALIALLRQKTAALAK